MFTKWYNKLMPTKTCNIAICHAIVVIFSFISSMFSFISQAFISFYSVGCVSVCDTIITVALLSSVSFKQLFWCEQLNLCQYVSTFSSTLTERSPIVTHFLLHFAIFAVVIELFVAIDLCITHAFKFKCMNGYIELNVRHSLVAKLFQRSHEMQ